MTDANTHDPLEQDLLEDEDTQKDKFLTFRIDSTEYGIAIRHVTEIISMQEITEVPEMHAYVKGIINLRGKVIPIIDVRLRFRMECRPYDDFTCIVIVSVNEMAVGIVVDTVCEVTTIPEEQISPPPQFQRDAAGRFIQGMGRTVDRVRILLDVERLLHEDLQRFNDADLPLPEASRAAPPQASLHLPQGASGKSGASQECMA